MQETVLGSVTTGVYVVTAQHQGQINGATVAWVTPVSYDPFLIMISLANIRVTHGLVNQSGYFGLNVLGKDQVELAKHFGFTTARNTNKLEGQSFTKSEKGLPILDGVNAYIECRLVNSYPAGEHTLFVGEVVDAKKINEKSQPLVFNQEDYF